MTAERKGKVRLVYAHAVVTYPDQLDTPLLHLDIDPAGTGIERIFYQFFHDRSRALNHLTGSNLVGQAGRQ